MGRTIIMLGLLWFASSFGIVYGQKEVDDAGSANCGNRGAASCILHTGTNLVKTTAPKPTINPYMSKICGGYCDNQNVCIDTGGSCVEGANDTLVKAFGETLGCQQLSAAECMVATANTPPMCMGWCQQVHSTAVLGATGLCLPLESTYCSDTQNYQLVETMQDLPCGSRPDCFDCSLGNNAATSTLICGWCPTDKLCIDSSLDSPAVCPTTIDISLISDGACPIQDVPLTTRAPVTNMIPPPASDNVAATLTAPKNMAILALATVALVFGGEF